MSKTFLTAEWRKLIMVNYAIDPEILKKYVPPHTELDFFNGVCYVSVIGFMFLKTKLKGIPVPLHRNFEEVNLRFYVRYKNAEGSYKRGAVFIKEFVPPSKFALAIVAKAVYNEPYSTLPMSHKWTINQDEITINYAWRKKNNDYSIEVISDNKTIEIPKNSEAEFITEHYWGYTKRGKNKTSEYGVEHPRWRQYAVKTSKISVNFDDLYGSDFAFLNNEKPTSVLLVEGSDIVIREGKNLKG
jgi:uncharacterized protein